MSDEAKYDSSKFSIGLKDSARYKCCNHPARPARLPSHVLCAECFSGLDGKMHALAQPSALRGQEGPSSAREGKEPKSSPVSAPASQEREG